MWSIFKHCSQADCMILHFRRWLKKLSISLHHILCHKLSRSYNTSIHLLHDFAMFLPMASASDLCHHWFRQMLFGAQPWSIQCWFSQKIYNNILRIFPHFRSEKCSWICCYIIIKCSTNKPTGKILVKVVIHVIEIIVNMIECSE